MADELVAAIAARSGIAEDVVWAMLSAKADIEAGVPAATVQRDSSNGDVAVRVVRNGSPGWWVISQSDGSAVWDLNPDKEWPALFTPDEA